MFESMWMKSNCDERDSASAMARCGASKIEMSCTAPIPMPVCFLNSAITGGIGRCDGAFLERGGERTLESARHEARDAEPDAALHECALGDFRRHDVLP